MFEARQSSAQENQYFEDTGQFGEHKFENLTSDSMTSLGSVPDEYTVFQNERGVDSQQYKKEVTPKTFNPRKQDVEDGNFETEMENEETRTSGIEVKYTLNVPSMITHLKRKDHYLESLDTFLNENLKAISDLKTIKKDTKLQLQQIKKMTERESETIKAQEDRGRKVEKEISHMLEENY